MVTKADLKQLHKDGWVINNFDMNNVEDFFILFDPRATRQLREDEVYIVVDKGLVQLMCEEVDQNPREDEIEGPLMELISLFGDENTPPLSFILPNSKKILELVQIVNVLRVQEDFPTLFSEGSGY